MSLEEVVEMRPINILRTVPEMVDPRHTALLIIDMQNDWLESRGLAAHSGRQIPGWQQLVPRIHDLAAGARSAGVLVIHARTATPPNGMAASPVWLEQLRRMGIVDANICLAGSWGHQIVAGLAPSPSDLIVEKFRVNAFIGTPLDLVLRSQQIRTIVCCGVSTNTSVDSTLRHGMQLDYYSILVADCCASREQQLHDATIDTIRERFGRVAASKELLDTWLGTADVPIQPSSTAL